MIKDSTKIEHYGMHLYYLCMDRSEVCALDKVSPSSTFHRACKICTTLSAPATLSFTSTTYHDILDNTVYT